MVDRGCRRIHSQASIKYHGPERVLCGDPKNCSRTSASGASLSEEPAGHQLAAVLQQSIASKSADFKVVQNDGTVKINTATARINADMKAFETSPTEGYFFAPLSSLPPSDSGFRERNQRDACYEELVARRSVSDVLGAMKRSLNNVVSFEWNEGNLAVKVNGVADPGAGGFGW